MVDFVRSHLENAPPTGAITTKLASLGEIFRPNNFVKISELALQKHEQGANDKKSTMAHCGAQEMVYRWLLDTPDIYTEAPAGIYS